MSRLGRPPPAQVGRKGAESGTLGTQLLGQLLAGRVGWRPPRPSREGYGLAGIVLIGFGCAYSFGLYRPSAVIEISLGACLVVLSATGLRRRALPLTWALAAYLGAVSTGFLFGSQPRDWLLPLVGGIGAALAILARPTVMRVLGAVGAASTSLEVVLVHLNWSHAPIDVFTFTQRAALQLLRGNDPYASAYATTTLHLPHAHYFYWPGVLLLSIPGRLLGDVRLSDLLGAVALIAGITILAKRRGGPEQAWRCLVLCLTLPFVPLMILLGWPEIYLVAAIALWLVLRDQHRIASIAILGLGVATVPTALPLLALPFLWWRRSRWEIAAAGLVAVAICLPFAVWDGPAHFISATLWTNLPLPPRPDGLDLDAALVRLTGGWAPSWVWPAVSGIVLVLVARAHPRAWPDAFYRGSALLVIAFLYAKWAFFNYYFLVAVGVVLGMALEEFWVGGSSTAPTQLVEPRREPIAASTAPSGGRPGLRWIGSLSRRATPARLQLAGANSSVVERLAYTEEVAGSNPASPTSAPPPRGRVSGCTSPVRD